MSMEVIADATATIQIPEQHLFSDENGNLNIAGVVKNTGFVPVKAVVGLKVIGKSHDVGLSIPNTTLITSTYSRILYPSESAPFKFALPSMYTASGRAFLAGVTEISAPLYDNLMLNYSNIAIGREKALVGTVKNVGSVDLHNVSVYASVHSKNKTQVDSVKSIPISVIKPGQELPFTAVPNSSVRQEVLYFSCAGLDFNEPMTTLKVDDGEFIPYDLQAIARVSSLRYVNSTDSIAFGIKHYNPEGGTVSLKIPQIAKNHTLIVSLDNKSDDRVSITTDDKTVRIDLFIPPGNHEVNIKGVRGKI